MMRIYKTFLMVLFLAVSTAGCSNTNVEGTPTGLIAPTVTSTNPADGDANVSLNRRIAATFSEEADTVTITDTTLTLMQGTMSVSGTVTSAGSIATFTPASDLSAGTEYTATITTGAAGLAGNALASNYVWSFTTGATADTTAPIVSSTNPLDNGVGTSINSNIAATFGESLDPETCTTTTFTLTQGATPVAGTATCVNGTATFDPTSDLEANTEYTATITTGIEDLSGNSLAADNEWSFTTSATADATAPTVSSTNPADTAASVVVNGNATATFSESMDTATITTATFTLTQGITPISGTVTSAGSVATFDPTSDLESDTTYTATITTGAKDLAGNALAAAAVWTFTTSASGATAAGPAPVVLGTAAPFAILTKSGVTDVPTSAITGNVGASPITGAAILVTCDEVTGTIFSVDAAGPAPCSVIDPVGLTANIGDMEIAYTDAAGRSIPDFTELGAGEIGGLTLVPGLYKWGTDVLISTDVTLSGGANDVWIFQIAGTLAEANGIHVNLLGGAVAQNIFWQVGGDNSGVGATIGTTAHFEGTVLALKAIALTTGATVNGRLLSQTAVTLQSNTIVKP